MDYRALCFKYREAADETNDAAEHDEIHAASVIAWWRYDRVLPPNIYVDRWLRELEPRVDKLLEK